MFYIRMPINKTGALKLLALVFQVRLDRVIVLLEIPAPVIAAASRSGIAAQLELERVRPIRLDLPAAVQHELLELCLGGGFAHVADLRIDAPRQIKAHARQSV